MVRGGIILLIVALTAPSLAAAQTMSFGDGAAMLGKSCAPDIVANCRGVNIDTTRLKDCLYRNQDVMSAQCKADYPKALDAIQKRIAARATVGRECEYEVVKKCGGKGREVFKSLVLPAGAAEHERPLHQVDRRRRLPGDRRRRNEAEQPGNAAGPGSRDACASKSLERSKSRGKNEPPPQKRPPIAPELNKLPTFNIDIQFDADTPIVKPESYQKLGQLADTLVNSALLTYTFLIVGHIESTGRRDNNVLLSQRRADAVRDILINTFKISSKRLQSVGLGEEQLLRPRPSQRARQQSDADHDAGEGARERAPAATAAKGAAAAKKKPAKKR